MTDQRLSECIHHLNSGSHKDFIFSNAISSNVDYGYVWKSELDDQSINQADEIFFIKDESNKYVGAVEYRTYHDLHCYLLEGCRGYGYMSKALKFSILPYIYFHLRSEDTLFQIVTNSRSLPEEIFNATQDLNERLGFKIWHDDNNDQNKFVEARLNWAEFDASDNNLTPMEYKGMSLYRRRILEEKTKTYASQIRKISDELKMAYGEDAGLSILAKQLKQYDTKIVILGEGFVGE